MIKCLLEGLCQASSNTMCGHKEHGASQVAITCANIACISES